MHCRAHPPHQPLDYSGLVAHLSWTEPANFLFLTLLTKGVFKRICDPIANCKAGRQLVGRMGRRASKGVQLTGGCAWAQVHRLRWRS